MAFRASPCRALLNPTYKSWVAATDELACTEHLLSHLPRDMQGILIIKSQSDLTSFRSQHG